MKQNDKYRHLKPVSLAAANPCPGFVDRLPPQIQQLCLEYPPVLSPSSKSGKKYIHTCSIIYVHTCIIYTCSVLYTDIQ